MKDSSGVAGIPISARDRHVMASSNQTFSTKVACFTRPSRVVRDGTSERRACFSVSPSKQPLSAYRCSSRKTSNWTRAGRSMESAANVVGSEDIRDSISKTVAQEQLAHIDNSGPPERACVRQLRTMLDLASLH